MPNMKLFVDRSLDPAKIAALEAALPDLRGVICAALAAPASACQLALIPVIGLADQPVANLEVTMIARPARTPEVLRAMGEALRDRVVAITGGACAVRMALVEDSHYLTVK